MFEPLYTAEEMRRAEERYPGYPDTVPELMERAGKAVADHVLATFEDARLAAAAAVTAHTEAARRVDQQEGLVASDVVEALPRVLHASV